MKVNKTGLESLIFGKPAQHLSADLSAHLSADLKDHVVNNGKDNTEQEFDIDEDFWWRTKDRTMDD